MSLKFDNQRINNINKLLEDTPNEILLKKAFVIAEILEKERKAEESKTSKTYNELNQKKSQIKDTLKEIEKTKDNKIKSEKISNLKEALSKVNDNYEIERKLINNRNEKINKLNEISERINDNIQKLKNTDENHSKIKELENLQSTLTNLTKNKNIDLISSTDLNQIRTDIQEQTKRINEYITRKKRIKEAEKEIKDIADSNVEFKDFTKKVENIDKNIVKISRDKEKSKKLKVSLKDAIAIYNKNEKTIEDLEKRLADLQSQLEKASKEKDSDNKDIIINNLKKTIGELASRIINLKKELKKANINSNKNESSNSETKSSEELKTEEEEIKKVIAELANDIQIRPDVLVNILNVNKEASINKILNGEMSVKNDENDDSTPIIFEETNQEGETAKAEIKEGGILRREHKDGTIEESYRDTSVDHLKLINKTNKTSGSEIDTIKESTKGILNYMLEQYPDTPIEFKVSSKFAKSQEATIEAINEWLEEKRISFEKDIQAKLQADINALDKNAPDFAAQKTALTEAATQEIEKYNNFFTLENYITNHDEITKDLESLKTKETPTPTKESTEATEEKPDPSTEENTTSTEKESTEENKFSFDEIISELEVLKELENISDEEKSEIKKIENFVDALKNEKRDASPEEMKELKKGLNILSRRISRKNKKNKRFSKLLKFIRAITGGIEIIAKDEALVIINKKGSKIEKQMNAAKEGTNIEADKNYNFSSKTPTEVGENLKEKLTFNANMEIAKEKLSNLENKNPDENNNAIFKTKIKEKSPT